MLVAPRTLRRCGNEWLAKRPGREHNTAMRRLKSAPPFPSLALFLVLAACPCQVHATPDRIVRVNETLVGIGDQSYAVLRTEDDNMGSYYSSRENIWLDEYPLEKAGREPVAQTHLLDVTISIDVEHTDPNTAPAITRTTQHKDTSQTLAGLYERYPRRAFETWSAEQMKDVTCHPEAGIHFRNRIPLLSAKAIQGAFTDRDHPWTLESISEGGGALFLRIVRKSPDEYYEARVFHVPPETTRKVHDQLALKEFYLAAGRYATHDEAIRVTQELNARSRAAKFFYFQPEIWEARMPTGKTEYVIVQENSMWLIETGRVEKTQEVLGVQLVPVSSKHFHRRTLVR